MERFAPDLDRTALAVLTRDTAPDPGRIRRDTVLLDGVWTLSVNGAPPEPVLVPFAPQSKLNGIAVPDEEVRLSYSTTLELPVAWDGAVLHFEGVDREAEVFLNGVRLGDHRGAYDPFSFVVPAWVLREGIEVGRTALHHILVEVRDSSSDRTVPCGKQERRAREGCIFYGNMSGLWKSAWIERAGPTRIADLRTTAGADGRLFALVEVEGAGEGHSVRLSLSHEGTGPTIQGWAPVIGGRAVLDLRVPDVHPWSLEAPHLYFGTLALVDGAGSEVDAFETYVGFRDFAMREGYYRLNGAPFLFQGLLNQAIYPDTLYTPTDAHTLTDFEQTRSLGFTGERRHQTTPRHRDLWLADRLGYWMSIEMPAARNLRDDAHRAAAIEEWRRIVAAYAWNHPSVLFLVPGNENWGLLTHAYHEVDATDAEREQFQIELGLATEKAAPPGLPYAANDGWRLVTSHRAGGADGRLDPTRLMFNLHDYASTAELRTIYGDLPRHPAPGQWGGNADYVFHSSDYAYDGQVPVMISEAGGRALLDRPTQGVFAYGDVHRDPEAWAVEVGELIVALGELPILRGGYVLTQTRDAGNDPEDHASLGEINGLLDGHGRPKHGGEPIRAANAAARAAFARALGTVLAA